MKKVALFAFNGESMCFIHVLLNALDMKERAYDVRIIIEGSATKLVAELSKHDHPFYNLYEKVKGIGLIDGACRACSNKMGVLSHIEAQGIELLGDMTGHPSIARYLEQGFQIITF
ncbi:MAG: hypothetical protein V2J25_17925 [Desulfatiglans sp.]|jgi:hypothetical protein|nr:hypothetical protein [Desulfatiglans sp.]